MASCGVCFVPVQAPARRSIACARTNSCCQGYAEAMATRRTLIRTRAPIFSNLSRIEPQVAVANWV